MVAHEARDQTEDANDDDPDDERERSGVNRREGLPTKDNGCNRESEPAQRYD